MKKELNLFLIVVAGLAAGYWLAHTPHRLGRTAVAAVHAASTCLVAVPDAKTLSKSLSTVVSDRLLAQTGLVAKLAGKVMRVEKLYAWLTKMLDGYIFGGANDALPRKDVYDPALFIMHAMVALQPDWAEPLKLLRQQYRKQKQPDLVVDWVCGVEAPKRLVDVQNNHLVCQQPRELARLLCKRYHVSTLLVYASVFAGSSALPLNKPLLPQALPSLVLDWSKHKDKRVQALRTFNGCRTCMLAMTPEAAAVASQHCLLC